MFGDVVDPSIKVGSNAWYTVPLSIVVHTAILVAFVIISLMAADVLLVLSVMMNAFVAAAPPPPAAATVSSRDPLRRSTWRGRRLADSHLASPRIMHKSDHLPSAY
jgi:hypothetical protein